MGENLEALGKPVEAVQHYRQAIAMDPSRAIRLQRKVIDLQLASSDWAPAEASIDAYLAAPQIADAERAWANLTKAQLLIDRGDYVDARRLLDDHALGQAAGQRVERALQDVGGGQLVHDLGAPRGGVWHAVSGAATYRPAKLRRAVRPAARAARSVC